MKLGNFQSKKKKKTTAAVVGQGMAFMDEKYLKFLKLDGSIKLKLNMVMSMENNF